jgi:hypothetical protein
MMLDFPRLNPRLKRFKTAVPYAGPPRCADYSTASSRGRQAAEPALRGYLAALVPRLADSRFGRRALTKLEAARKMILFSCLG